MKRHIIISIVFVTAACAALLVFSAPAPRVRTGNPDSSLCRGRPARGVDFELTASVSTLVLDVPHPAQRKEQLSINKVEDSVPVVIHGEASPAIKPFITVPRASKHVSMAVPTVDHFHPISESVGHEKTRKSFPSSGLNFAKFTRKNRNEPSPSSPSPIRELSKPPGMPKHEVTTPDVNYTPDNAPDVVEHSADIAVVASTNVQQPAVWVDLGPASDLSPETQGEIQNMAESLQQRIAESGLDPTSPEYRQLWNESVADSDQVFRTLYGTHAWMQHHVEAYHLAHSAEEQGVESPQ